MRFLEPVRVTVFESQIPILLFARSLLFEILLRRHVQLSGRGQLCVVWRLLSRFLADPVTRAFFRSPAMSRRDEYKTPSRRTRQRPPVPSAQKNAPA
jgi:hypothetical protein